MNKTFSDLLPVFVVVALSTAYAAVFGFINTDAWYYVQLASALWQGQGCSVGGRYFAVFPCGYPAALALLIPTSDFAALIIGSKFVNALLILASFLCLRAFTGANWLASFVVIAPATLFMLAYTWSENLFLFAVCWVLLLIRRIARSPDFVGVVLLSVALLIGVSSRYFFAPYAFLLWLGAFVLYGSRTALRALPAFAVAAMAYFAYSAFNQHLTGFATGTERQPSLETLTFLVTHFLWKIGSIDLLRSLAVLAMMVVLARASLDWRSPREAWRDASCEIKLLLWAGVAFLLLALILRIRAQYDLFSTRTIGHGLIFVVAALAGMAVRVLPSRRFPVAATLAAGLLSLVIAQWQTLPVAAGMIARGEVRSVPSLLKAYGDRFTHKQVDAVLTFSIPGPSALIMFNANLYYGTHAKIINPDTRPGPMPDTVASLTRKLSQYREGQCVVDFTPYDTRAQLAIQLEASYDLDVRLSLKDGKPVREKMSVYDADLAQYLLERFVPGAVVDCREMFPG